MLAYTYPLLDFFWTLLMLAAVVVVMVIIIRCLLDNFVRTDHSGWAKAGWTVLIVFLPILGSLIYMIARPSEIL
jgi:hypothetical protein